MIQPKAAWKLAAEAADLAASHIRTKLNFNPESEEEIDPEKHDAVFYTISLMASVVIGWIIGPMDKDEVPKACHHLTTQAMALVEASKVAQARIAEQTDTDSPIILPKKGPNHG